MEMIQLMYETITKPLRDKIYNLIKYPMLHDYIDYKCIQNECLQYGFTLEEYQKKIHNNNMKYKRCYNRIKLYFEKYKYIYFGTLTFDNEHIEKEEYYFKQYKRILTKTKYQYIVNKDIGTKKERIHYHIILASNTPIKKSNLNWQYGFMDLKKIPNQDKGKITKYLLKLNRHAFKESSFKRLIYSRISKNN